VVAVEKRGLNLEVITSAAVALLDEVGLAELSTRRLAAKLGVQSPTLYWHVQNKAELLDLVAEAVCANTVDVDATTPWRDQLAGGLRQFRALLLAHRDTAALLRERPPGPARLGHIDATTAALLDAGCDPTEAPGIARLLFAHVLDSTAEPDDFFELGLDVILDGLEQRLLR
jgi:TetR/AcrR family tetracycline transcriptional repressor